MKKRIIHLLSLATITLGLNSCYKDKGNYTYSDINQITIKTSADNYNVVLPDSLKIDLLLEQTIPDAAGLSFQWVLFPQTSAPLTRRTLDTTQNLRAKITEEPGSYLLDVFVKDRKTGVEFQKRFGISIFSAFSEGWVVLEEKSNGCDLSMITPADVVFRNIYSDANKGQLLPAGTFRLPDIKTNRNVQSVYIISPNDVTQVHFSNFLKIAGFNDFFWQAPTPAAPQHYFLNGDDEMMLNNGKPHTRSLITTGVNKLTLSPEGNYYMAPYEIYTSSSNYVLFDTIARKFFKINMSSVTLIPFAAWDGVSAFDVNNIDKRFIYAEQNTGAQFNAIFKHLNNDSLYAYVINPTLAQPGVNKYEGLTAPGLASAKLFVMSKALPHLYYASGNQVYKLDLPAKTATPIYTFPAGTEIRAMKMYLNRKTSSDANNNKLIGIATWENGTEGKVYYFPIAATGNFTGNTYSKVYSGFGKINDITFKSQK
jgi:hypothetical protein